MNETRREPVFAAALLLTPAALGAGDWRSGAALGVFALISLSVLTVIQRRHAKSSAPRHGVGVLLLATFAAAIDVAVRALSWATALQVQPWLPLLAIAALVAVETQRANARASLPIWTWVLALVSPIVVGAVRSASDWPWLSVGATWLLLAALLLAATARWLPPPADTTPRKARRVRVTGPVS